jgi:hypothetical protein
MSSLMTSSVGYSRVHRASVPSNPVHSGQVRLNQDAGSDNRREYVYIIISDKYVDCFMYRYLQITLKQALLSSCS